jgi:CelD/BcsL family acetyltransferase involved in cellulose biosynthesis
MSDAYTVDFHDVREALASSELRSSWIEVIGKATNLRAALQRPEWVEYRSFFAEGLSVGFVRDLTGHVVGVVPLLEDNYPLTLVSSMPWLRLPLRSSMLMGNDPLSPPDWQVYHAVFAALTHRADVNAIYIPGVVEESEFRNFLADGPIIHSTNWFLYWLEPSLTYYYIDMPDCFNQYYEKFDANMRRNFRRERKRLEAIGGGDIELVRVETEEQAADFLKAAHAIAEKSWQKFLIGFPINRPGPRLNLLINLARQKVLRSYLLKCAGLPCAYAVGFQSNKVFYYYEIAYDPKLSKASPGKILLFMLLGDLFATRRPKIFYFGPGDFHYKRWFANAQGQERTIYVLRTTLANRIRINAHRSSRWLVNTFKRT